MQVLQTAGIDVEAPGVLTGEKSDEALAAGLVGALGLHGAWNRTPLVRASLVPPTV